MYSPTECEQDASPPNMPGLRGWSMVPLIIGASRACCGPAPSLVEDTRMVALKLFFLSSSSDTANSNGHGRIRTRSCSLRRSQRIRCTQAGSSVEGSRGLRRSSGAFEQWKGRTFFQREGKELQWQKKGKRKKMFRNHLDEETRRRFNVSVGIAENSPSIEGLQGKATEAVSRRVKFSWTGK